MKTSRVARPVLLFAVSVSALALAGSGLASLVASELPDWVGQNNTRHVGAVLMQPALEELIAPFNFQAATSAIYFVRQSEMLAHLAGRGLTKTGRTFVDTQQVDTWYSPAEDRSVVCVSWADGKGYNQTAYVMTGKVRRADVVPLP